MRPYSGSHCEIQRFADHNRQNTRTGKPPLYNDVWLSAKPSLNSPSTGLGFSRPKPVFPVQNGINLFFPVFPVQNWEKLGKTGKNYAGLYLSQKKCPKMWFYQIKIEQDTLGTHFIHTVVMTYELITQILWTQIFAVVLLLIQLVLTFPHNTNHVQNCDLIFKYQ